MNKTRRTLQLLATPVVVVGIYAWMLRAAYRDLRTMLKKQRGVS